MSAASGRISQPLLGLLGIAIWLGTWQWFTTVGPLADVQGLTSATMTLEQSWRLAGDGGFWSAVVETLAMALSGTALAVMVGVFLGVLMGRIPAVNAALDPTLQFLRPIPPVVILPLVLLVLGPTRELGVFLAAVAALWPILVQVLVGVRDVEPVALDAARSMRLSWSLTQRSVVIPSAVPYLMSGIRIGATTALLVSIGVGLLAGSPGLGRTILFAQQNGDSPTVFALTLASGVIGLAFAGALAALERWLTRGRQPAGNGRG